MLRLSDPVCSACGGNIWRFSAERSLGPGGKTFASLGLRLRCGQRRMLHTHRTGRCCQFPWTDGKNDKLKTYAPHRKHFPELFGRLTAIRWGTRRCWEPGEKINPWKHRRCAGEVFADLTAENQNGVFPPWRDDFFFLCEKLIYSYQLGVREHLLL